MYMLAHIVYERRCLRQRRRRRRHDIDMIVCASGRASLRIMHAIYALCVYDPLALHCRLVLGCAGYFGVLAAPKKKKGALFLFVST